MFLFRNILGNDGEYKMLYFLFVIYVVFFILILVVGVFVNMISVGVIVRLKFVWEKFVFFIFYLMIVNFVVSIIVMFVLLVNLFYLFGRKDMFCRIIGFVVFFFIGV